MRQGFMSRAAATLATVVATVSAWGAGDDAARWAQVRDCAARGDSAARHACVDEVLRAAGVLTPEAEAREQRQRFGLERAAPRTAATPPPSPAPASASASPAPATAQPASPARTERPPAPPEPPSELQVEVATARVTPDKRVVFTTTDGGEWRQTEAQSIPRGPKPGDTIIIHRAALGSFLCELPRRASWRCARTR